ncbi:MAG: phosphoenolpyruvate carboxylase [Bdellovibrio sp. CG10_big_fil_rev_8_21_14_0_10_47_8]|nr:MAG: phosphoenolpyruvate carboxylase [Bdellovibrio sp. CG10_big_fil_rev_8_21_14_0_10_47_8]
MSEFPTRPNIEIIHPRPEHFSGIQELCRKVYPFSKPWSIEQLESHRSYFPGGQLIAVETETGKIVGLAFSLIISWDDYSPHDSWVDFTSGGFFHNHNPKKGKTLYGAEVMVDPELRGLGIGKMLYHGRQEIVQKYGLKRIRAGARLRGYSKFEDKMSAHDYVIQVAEKKIFDPTLSFQLNQGFVVIDVAKNYLFNDPESLGYAAVIEWLNPDVATTDDVKKQKDSVDIFLSNQKYISEFLPRELHRLVRKSTLLLGDVIREAEGPAFYRRIEHYRTQLKKMRGSTTESKLNSLMKDVQKESAVDQFKIAHAFALQLEIVNVCEAAYRTWRQRQKPVPQGIKQRVDLKFVLTAHPTEARSPIMVEQLQKLTELLINEIHNNFVFSEQELMSQIRFLWHLPLSKRKAPTVLDEADFIFSLVFSEKVFDFFLSENPSYNLKLRTWVGGDKDGHPGVNSEIMRGCLNLSRNHILRVLQKKLTIVLDDLERLEGISQSRAPGAEAIRVLIKDLDSLRKISTSDGSRVKKWILKYRKLLHGTPPVLSKHYQITLIQQMLEVFPALVLPIELREDAQQIKLALSNKQSPIRQMLSELSRISGPMSIIFYARGLVISHCESADDIENAAKLTLLAGKSKVLPIIPLFESKEALVNAKRILKLWLKTKSHIEQVKRHWLGFFEVMLGYSDSAKEIGVLPSRQLIQKSMHDIETVLRSHGVKPVFFHGSGGSVARGGGSLKEQISWWPNSAIERPKITIQGEMIQRLFATKEILKSQCTHLSNEAMWRRTKKVQWSPHPLLKTFSSYVEMEYKGLISDPTLLDQLLNASPYKYLDVLRIGSRPAKRNDKGFSISSLRAIPWVLCWTQTRSLFPTWWGVGTAWKKLTDDEKEQLRKEFKENPFFSSFVKSLGFTLAKVDMNIWKLYFQRPFDDPFFKKFDAEYKAAMEFVFSVTGEKSLIWYRPWLEESIRLRAPQIHILNILQILAMKRQDEVLLKETLVGIACGMLTTG